MLILNYLVLVMPLPRLSIVPSVYRCFLWGSLLLLIWNRLAVMYSQWTHLSWTYLVKQSSLCSFQVQVDLATTFFLLLNIWCQQTLLFCVTKTPGSASLPCFFCKCLLISLFQKLQVWRLRHTLCSLSNPFISREVMCFHLTTALPCESWLWNINCTSVP